MTRKKSLPFKGISPDAFTDRHKEIFLKVFSETNSVKQAAAHVGFSRSTIYKHLQKDEKFREEFKRTNDIILDNLEAEAYRRAVTGVKKPIYYQGTLVGHELTYSDKLLEMLLRGRSDKYSNKTSLKVEGSVDLNVNSAKEKLLEKALSRGIVIDQPQDEEEAEFKEIKEEGGEDEQV